MIKNRKRYFLHAATTSFGLAYCGILLITYLLADTVPLLWKLTLIIAVLLNTGLLGRGVVGLVKVFRYNRKLDKV